MWLATHSLFADELVAKFFSLSAYPDAFHVIYFLGFVFYPNFFKLLPISSSNMYLLWKVESVLRSTRALNMPSACFFEKPVGRVILHIRIKLATTLFPKTGKFTRIVVLCEVLACGDSVETQWVKLLISTAASCIGKLAQVPAAVLQFQLLATDMGKQQKLAQVLGCLPLHMGDPEGAPSSWR